MRDYIAMRYLLDTSCLIEYFTLPRSRNASRVIRIRALIRKESFLCGLVLAELMQGMKSNEQPLIESVIPRIPFLDTPKEVFERGGTLSRDLKNQGILTPLHDCLIASQAIHDDCTLATADRHFERFIGLKLLLLE